MSADLAKVKDANADLEAKLRTLTNARDDDKKPTLLSKEALNFNQAFTPEVRGSPTKETNVTQKFPEYKPRKVRKVVYNDVKSIGMLNFVRSFINLNLLSSADDSEAQK